MKISLRDGPFLCVATIASTFRTRGVGLLGRKFLEDTEGLLIVPCSSVHTWMMQFPIDVLYINKENVITKTVSNMRPFRMSFGGKRAHKVLELNSGAIKKHLIRPGQSLDFEVNTPPEI